MSNKPFFSVVIPVYNSEKYLDDCIQSIISQSFQDFELILVDDESKDRSPQICDKWGNDYPEIVKVIHQKNTGVYIAKRNGIKATSGSYIYVMDNDDLITSPDAFKNIKNKIDNTKTDLVIFNVTDDIETGHLLCKLPFSDNQIFEGRELSTIYDEYLSTKNIHHIWMMVFNRELFDWDYEYDEPFRMLRDGPSLVLPIISNAKRIVYIQDVYYYWRIQNQTSASKHYDVLNFYYSIQSLHKRVLKYSEEWDYKSEKTEDLVRKNYMTDICISAIKVRSMSKNSKLSRKECLKLMSNDECFRKEYTLKYLEGFRKPIVWALYHKQYWLVNFVSSLVGMMKHR